jgi:hypothetical protein
MGLPYQVDVRQNRGAALSKHSHSPAIWYDCPWESINNGEVGGVTHFNDFDSMPLIPTETTQIAYDRYKVFATASGTVVPVLTVNSVSVDKGVLSVAPDASAHSASLAQAYGNYKVSGDKTTSNKLWFECRVAVSTNGIVTNRLGWMIGLAEVDLWTLATGVPFSSNAGAITNSAAFLGFEHLPADTTQIRTAYSDRATAFTEVGSGQGVLAANTFTNLGFIYDPFYPDNTKRVRFFQDNVELTTGVSQTLLTGFTNLNANSLGLIVAAVGGSASSSDALYVQWWRAAQLAVA